MTFLEQYDALGQAGGDPRQAAEHQLALLQDWVVQRPGDLFAELRVQRPVFLTPGPIVVSRYKDVVEVIDSDDVFSVRPYGEAMMRNNGGPNFVLGMDDGPEFEHDLAVLKLAVRRGDLPNIRTIVEGATAALTDAARDQGRLDITDGFARLIPTQFVGRYFGVPGPDSGTLTMWVRAMFTDIFLNFTHDERISAVGMRAGQEFRAYVDGLIAGRHAERRAGAPPRDDVLGRLIEMQCVQETGFTDSRIRDNLIGCVVGVIENTQTAAVNVMNFLFDHPEQLSGAVSAARAGDTDLLGRYVFESLRFHSAAPVMVRFSLHEHVLAKGTARESRIPAQRIIFAANGSAMMDETELDEPLSFRLDRPQHHYLHFGWGLHQCLGKYISGVQIVEIVKGLLLLPGIRRAAGPDGALRYAGPFPTSFVVEFAPHDPSSVTFPG